MTVVNPGDDIAAAVTAAGVNGTLLFMPGTHRYSTNVIIRPLNGQTFVFTRGAVVKGSAVLSSWVVDSTEWKATGQTQDFSASYDSREDEDTHGLGNLPDFFMDGVLLGHVLSRGALGAGKCWLDTANNVVYVRDNPNGRLMEATKTERMFQTNPTNPADNVSWLGSGQMMHFGNSAVGVSTQVTNWRLEDLDFSYAHQAAFAIGGAAGVSNPDTGYSTNLVVRNVKSHDNGMNGYSITKQRDLLVENVELARNNSYIHFGNDTISNGGGVSEGNGKYLFIKNATIRGLISYDADGDGIWFDTDAINIVVELCVLRHNSRHGIHYEASQDAEIRYNSIEYNGPSNWPGDPDMSRWGGSLGIHNSTSKNVTFHHNLLRTNSLRMMSLTWGSRGSSPSGYGEHQSSNCNYHHNVLYLRDTGSDQVGENGNSTPDARLFTSGNDFQNNTYFAPVSTTRANFRWNGANKTFAQWQALGFDTAGSISLG